MSEMVRQPSQNKVLVVLINLPQLSNRDFLFLKYFLVKIEAVDSSEIETVEFNESDTETIDTMEPGPSSAAPSTSTALNSSSKSLYLKT